jgi:hypothetical protein
MPSIPSSEINVSNTVSIEPTTLGPAPPPTLIESGSIGHYFAPSADLINVQPTTTPIQVQIANQQYMQSTHTAELPVQGIPPAARQVHVFPNMATNLLAPGPLLVQQGCTLQMDSQQCVVQCPNCQPIHCPINTQGLYLLPATAYNTVDVDEYIDRANHARFATAVRDISEQADDPAAMMELSEQSPEQTVERFAATPNLRDDDISEQQHRANHARVAAEAFALAEEQVSEGATTIDLSEQPPTPRRSNLSAPRISPRWASNNRFATPEQQNVLSAALTTMVEVSEFSANQNRAAASSPHWAIGNRFAALTMEDDGDKENTTQPTAIDTEPPELLQSSMSAAEEDDDEEPVVTPDTARSEHTTISEPLAEAQKEYNQRAKDIMTVAIVATSMVVSVQDPSSTPAEMVAFCHVAMYSPAISTMETAMKKG